MINSSYIRKNKNLLVLFFISLGLSLYAHMVYEGLSKKLDKKISAQEKSLENSSQWKARYESLRNVDKDFKKQYPISFKDVTGVLSLYRAIGIERYGVEANIDDLKVSKVSFNKTQEEIGVFDICLKDSDQFSVWDKKNDINNLIKSIEALENTSYLSFNKVLLHTTDSDQYVAKLSNFCVSIRAESSDLEKEV